MCKQLATWEPHGHLNDEGRQPSQPQIHSSHLSGCVTVPPHLAHRKSLLPLTARTCTTHMQAHRARGHLKHCWKMCKSHSRWETHGHSDDLRRHPLSITCCFVFSEGMSHVERYKRTNAPRTFVQANSVDTNYETENIGLKHWQYGIHLATRYNVSPARGKDESANVK